MESVTKQSDEETLEFDYEVLLQNLLLGVLILHLKHNHGCVFVSNKKYTWHKFKLDVFHTTPLGSFIEFIQTTLHWNKVSQTLKQLSHCFSKITARQIVQKMNICSWNSGQGSWQCQVVTNSNFLFKFYVWRTLNNSQG